MGRHIQSSFFNAEVFKGYNRTEHGGVLHKGKRKLARPLDTKRPMHVVLRSSRAMGRWSFLLPRNAQLVRSLLKIQSAKFGIRVYDCANAGNHLHLIIKAQTRLGFQNFLRTFGALLARKISGAKKGMPIVRLPAHQKTKSGVGKEKFWDALAYTRVVNWGRDFIATRRYVLRNKLEAVGFVSHKMERALSFSEVLKKRGIILMN